MLRRRLSAIADIVFYVIPLAGIIYAVSQSQLDRALLWLAVFLLARLNLILDGVLSHNLTRREPD